MLVYSTSDGGAAIGAYAPAKATLPSGATVDVDTRYPFEDQIHISVTTKAAMPLHLRIPGWATKASVSNGTAETPVSNGTMFKVECAAGSTTITLNLNSEIRLETWFNGAQSVHKGALLYSLPLAADYTVTAHHFGGADDSNDYYATTKDPWNVAIDIDPAAPSDSLTFTQVGYVDGTAAFNHSNWPTHIQATVCTVPSWGVASNSAAEPPSSPACTKNSTCGAPRKVWLVPHGGTDLRIGEFPLSGF